MATGLFHSIATFKAVSGLPSDDVTMSWSTIVDNAMSTALAAESIGEHFQSAFINGAQTNGSKLADFLGPSLSRSANMFGVATYGPLTGAQLGGAKKGQPATYMGSPVFEELYTLLGPAALQELPRQASVDLCLRATGWEVAPVEAVDGSDLATAVDRPRQRLTGRLKLGPFGDSWDAIGPGGESRPAAQLVNTLLLAANLWRDNAFAEGLTLAVWSRANQSFIPVTDVQVPNAWSNVIRRKPRVTARNTTPVD